MTETSEAKGHPTANPNPCPNTKIKQKNKQKNQSKEKLQPHYVQLYPILTTIHPAKENKKGLFNSRFLRNSTRCKTDPRYIAGKGIHHHRVGPQDYRDPQGQASQGDPQDWVQEPPCPHLQIKECWECWLERP
jgi:hypothetical protein